jgi:membrane protein YqaA with SNARE-associated domain
LLRLEQQSGRPWFLPLVGAFPLCDYFLPFLPNQILLAGLSMLRPQRWLALALTFVTATAVGAALITVAIQHYGMPFLSQHLGNMPEPAALAPVLEQVRERGLLALFLLALLPWPPRLAVLACALVGLSPVQVGLAVLAGRVLPAGLYAGLGAKAPGLLRRLASVDRLMREMEAEKRGLVR